MRSLKRLLATLIAICYMLLFTDSFAQNIGISAIGTEPDKSALLDLNSTDRGFLVTRAEPSNISSPAFGLITLAPSDSCLYMFSGKKWLNLGGVGNKCSSTTSEYPGGFKDVINPITGDTWMDRNLGASQVATSSDDPLSYGDLYQWGRNSDGHEKRNSEVTPTQSTTDDPGHEDFIKTSDDWRSPKNDNLWQGAVGTNNPCPTDYRLPTRTELDSERLSWSSNDDEGAFASPLKLPATGNRARASGALSSVGIYGYYWSSTINSLNATRLFYSNANALMRSAERAEGSAVRCIKD